MYHNENSLCNCTLRTVRCCMCTYYLRRKLIILFASEIFRKEDSGHSAVRIYIGAIRTWSISTIERTDAKMNASCCRVCIGSIDTLSVAGICIQVYRFKNICKVGCHLLFHTTEGRL